MVAAFATTFQRIGYDRGLARCLLPYACCLLFQTFLKASQHVSTYLNVSQRFSTELNVFKRFKKTENSDNRILSTDIEACYIRAALPFDACRPQPFACCLHHVPPYKSRKPRKIGTYSHNMDAPLESNTHIYKMIKQFVENRDFHKYQQNGLAYWRAGFLILCVVRSKSSTSKFEK